MREFTCAGSDFLLGQPENSTYAVIGEVNCGGSEPELLECAHATIGKHSCSQISSSTPDIVISCDCGIYIGIR